MKRRCGEARAAVECIQGVRFISEFLSLLRYAVAPHRAGRKGRVCGAFTVVRMRIKLMFSLCEDEMASLLSLLLARCDQTLCR